MYLIDGRGQHLLRSLESGLFERLVGSAVGMADAKIGVLTPEGLTERVNPIKDAGTTDIKIGDILYGTNFGWTSYCTF